MPATEIVSGIKGQRVYLCGYMATANGSSLNFQIVSGTGDNCADEQMAVTDLIQLPSNPQLVNRTPYVLEHGDPGHSLCWLTAGNNGSLGLTIYWTQF